MKISLDSAAPYRPSSVFIILFQEGRLFQATRRRAGKETAVALPSAYHGTSKESGFTLSRANLTLVSTQLHAVRGKRHTTVSALSHGMLVSTRLHAVCTTNVTRSLQCYHTYSWFEGLFDAITPGISYLAWQKPQQQQYHTGRDKVGGNHPRLLIMTKRPIRVLTRSQVVGEFGSPLETQK